MDPSQQPIRAGGPPVINRGPAFDAWIAFLRASFLYPRTNARVAQRVSELIEVLATGSGAGPRHLLAPITKPAELTKLSPVVRSTHEWFSECLERSSLAGIGVHPTVPAESLLDLAEALRWNFQRPPGSTDLKNLPQIGFAGVDLLELHFDGVFRDDPVDDDPDSLLNTGANRGALSDVLRRDSGILKSLGALQAALRGYGARDLEDLETKVLDDLAENLPDEPTSDRKKTCELGTRVLREMTKRISDQGQDWSDDAARARLLDMTRTVAELFVRRDFAGADPSATQSDGPRGHAGDELVTDDVDGLLSAIGTLPPLPRDGVSTNDAVELLVILVHEYLDSENPSVALTEQLRSALASGLSDTELSRVAWTFAAPLVSPLAPSDGGRARRWVAFLRSETQLGLLRPAVRDHVDQFTEAFPLGFGLLLESLDPAQPDARATLIRFCESIGPERVLHARETLLADERLSEAELSRRLLAVPHAAVLPLVACVVEKVEPGSRLLLVDCLRSACPAGIAADTLRLVSETALPNWYLRALAECQGRAPRSLEERSARLLMDAYGSASNDAAGHTRRLEIIDVLGRIGTAAAREQLTTIAAVRTWFDWRGRRRALKAAARAALKTVRQEGADDVAAAA